MKPATKTFTGWVADWMANSSVIRYELYGAQNTRQARPIVQKDKKAHHEGRKVRVTITVEDVK